MKNQSITFSFVLGIILVLFSGCDFLDKQPTERLTLDKVFADDIETKRYLWNVYSYIPDESNVWAGTPWVGSADEADMTWERAGYDTYLVNQGNYSPTTYYYQNWGYYYEGIRSASVFMNRVGENPELTETQITRFTAEARFLRAYFYYLLLRQYGPVVIMEEVLPVDAPAEALQIPRSSFDECVNYIVQELGTATQNLPLEIINDNWLGRATKGAAMAVKSTVLLYAASPLYNGNEDYANFTNQDGTQLMNTTYDETKWKRAADAAKAVIDLNQYSLYTYGDGSDPYLNYKELFLDKWNEETIWGRSNNGAWNLEIHSAPRSVNGWSGVAPTQAQVDAYFMANGKSIHASGSGYVEEGFSTEDRKYTIAGTWMMYVNREPRFYASITYNGKVWPFSGERVELFAEGSSGSKGSYDHSKTGYLLYKFTNPDSDIVQRNIPHKVWILFRLGEIYLNYAEALNEYNPGHPDIAKYVNLIRNRSGLPDLPANLSQDEMRQAIHHERRVELAFEGHRYFDTRRWKIAPETDAGPFYGMNISAGDSFDDEAFYQRTAYETRSFESKNYLWPLPQNAVNRNKELVQNPGW